MFPSERQIEFPKEQMHHPWVTPGCWLLSIACIVAVVIIVTASDWHSFFGPW